MLTFGEIDDQRKIVEQQVRDKFQEIGQDMEQWSDPDHKTYHYYPYGHRENDHRVQTITYQPDPRFSVKATENRGIYTEKYRKTGRYPDDNYVEREYYLSVENHVLKDEENALLAKAIIARYNDFHKRVAQLQEVQKLAAALGTEPAKAVVEQPPLAYKKGRWF